MGVIDKLARKYDHLGIANLTYYLLGGQVLSYVFLQARPELLDYFYLAGNRVLSGEFYRVALFLFKPVSFSLFTLLLAWYGMYLFGTMLEREWGSFRYTLYVLLAFVFTLVASALFPFNQFDNSFIFLSTFLAFAYLFPDVVVYVFFIIPVKVKWLGYLGWFSIILALITGDFAGRVLAVMSVGNFFLFFGQDLLQSASFSSKTITRVSAGILEKKEPRHVCTVCNKNELTNPDMEIRYCSKCIPERCYCALHIHNHDHIVKGKKQYVN